MALSISLAVVISLVLVLLGREIGAYRANREAYGLRRLTLRLAAGVMLLYLLGSILAVVSLPWLNLVEPYPTPDLWLTFWGSVALLAAAIICLIVADFRLVSDDSRKETNRIWREMAETIAQHELKKKE